MLVLCFAVSKNAEMRAEKIFEHLCSRLLEMGRQELAEVDFRKLCESEGADVCRMSNLMYANYGQSPDEVVALLCTSWDKTYGNN